VLFCRGQQLTVERQRPQLVARADRCGATRPLGVGDVHHAEAVAVLGEKQSVRVERDDVHDLSRYVDALQELGCDGVCDVDQRDAVGTAGEPGPVAVECDHADRGVDTHTADLSRTRRVADVDRDDAAGAAEHGQIAPRGDVVATSFERFFFVVRVGVERSQECCDQQSDDGSRVTSHAQRTTKLTSRPGTTTVLTSCLPSRWSATVCLASVSKSSLEALRGARVRPRTLPRTCTTSSKSSSSR